ncbi:MAG: hypothetical protein ACK5XF_00120 [Neisseriaceae bacterium]
MKTDKHSVDGQFYRNFIMGYLRNNQIDIAISLKAEMKTEDTDAILFSALISKLADNKRIKEALNYLEELTQLEHIRPDKDLYLNLYIHLIESCFNNNACESAMAIFQNTIIELNGLHYSLYCMMIYKFLDNNRFDLAERIFQDLQKVFNNLENQHYSENFINYVQIDQRKYDEFCLDMSKVCHAIIHWLLKNKDITTALDFFNYAKENSHLPNDILYQLNQITSQIICYNNANIITLLWSKL